MEDVCGNCNHHIWADHLSYHVCVKATPTEGNERPKKPLNDTCEIFRSSRRYQDVEKTS